MVAITNWEYIWITFPKQNRFLWKGHLGHQFKSSPVLFWQHVRLLMQPPNNGRKNIASCSSHFMPMLISPEFTWSVSYSIAKLLMFCKNSSTLHTWGQCQLWDHLSLWGKKGQTWLSFVVFDTFNVLNILSYPVSTMGPTMVGPGEKFSKQRFSDGWKTLSWDWFLQYNIS